MPNWKKIALSGSNPEFGSLIVDNAITASYFTGDGSALTGVTSTIVEESTSTCANVFGPYKCWLPVTNQISICFILLVVFIELSCFSM